MENKKLQWNLDWKKGQGIDKILGLPMQRRFPSKFIKNPFLVYVPRVLLGF